MRNDVVDWLQERAFKRCGATMNAVHTKTQEWLWADEITRLREENARLREQINSAYDKGRESRGKVVAAGHALFVYAQKVTHKIKHHSLEKLFPLPDSELLAFIEAVNESSKSERARAAIREGGKDD